jgi:hypothetical protein
VRREVHQEPDLSAVAGEWTARPNGKASQNGKKPEEPKVLSLADLMKIDLPKPEMLIESMTPERGAELVVAAGKTGKTILAVQKVKSVASGKALFNNYRVVRQGPAMIVEQDDPDGGASIKQILERSGATEELPIYIVPQVPFVFGPEMLGWMERQIVSLSLRLLVLDSYTALRGPRHAGADIVKVEQAELREMDTLAKRRGCAIQIIHHPSKGSVLLDWNDSAGGTYAMAMATEGMVHMSRFRDLDMAAPERLVRVRMRHGDDVEMVLRFRKETLDFEHVLEGGAAPLYPLLVQIKTEFGSTVFGPRELSQELGISRATAHRQIDRLYTAGAIKKLDRGKYVLVETLR